MNQKSSICVEIERNGACVSTCSSKIARAGAVSLINGCYSGSHVLPAMQIFPPCPAKCVGPKIRTSSGSIGTPPGLIPCVTPLIAHVEARALMTRAFKCVTMLAFLGSQSALQANCSCTCVTPSSPLRLQRFALLADRGPTCSKVNNGIPDSLKRENASTSNTQCKADPVPMGQAVESIDRTWYPGDENCKPKDEAGPQVGHLDGIKPLEFQ